MIIFSHVRQAAMVKPQGGEVMSEVITLMVIILLIIVTIKEK